MRKRRGSIDRDEGQSSNNGEVAKGVTTVHPISHLIELEPFLFPPGLSSVF